MTEYTFYDKEGEEVNAEALIPVISSDLRKAFNKRIEAKNVENKGKELKAEANEQFDTVFVLLEEEGIVRVKVDDLGSIGRQANVPRKTLNQDKLKELLIAKGLSTRVVNNCFDKATKEGKVKEPWKYVYKGK